MEMLKIRLRFEIGRFFLAVLQFERVKRHLSVIFGINTRRCIKDFTRYSHTFNLIVFTIFLLFNFIRVQFILGVPNSVLLLVDIRSNVLVCYTLIVT